MYVFSNFLFAINDKTNLINSQENKERHSSLLDQNQIIIYYCSVNKCTNHRFYFILLSIT